MFKRGCKRIIRLTIRVIVYLVPNFLKKQIVKACEYTISIINVPIITQEQLELERIEQVTQNLENNRLLQEYRHQMSTFYYTDIQQKSLLNEQYIYHVSTMSGGNTGDCVLSSATEDVYNKFSVANSYYNSLVWEIPDLDIISRSKALMIGGGGLLWYKPYSEDSSGWQWNCTLDALDQIKVPMFCFGIGWILREGQSFSPLFFKHFTQMLAKDNFRWCGLRNHYTIEKVLEFLPQELHQKVSLQPCATTLGSTLYPQYNHSQNYIGDTINIAFVLGMDQVKGLSHGKDYPGFLSEMEYQKFKSELISFMLFLANQGVQVYFVAHTNWESEAYFNEFQELHNHPNVIFHSLLYFPATFVYDFYKDMTAVFGMRYHGAVIPTGLQVPTFIIGANKERTSIAKEWGMDHLNIDISSPDFLAILHEKWDYLLKNYPSMKTDIKNLQQKHFEITKNNIDTFLSSIK
ncbi:MAG: polysaccharide pyruvyl transferase family protein [Brevinema sp.]